MSVSFNMQWKPQLIVTGDGSKSLNIPQLNESYHSKHGAVTESQHVFIKEGLGYLKEKKIKILELGFGTGLNCFLSWIYALENKLELSYEGIELFPINDELYELLDYELCFEQKHALLYDEIVKSKWNVCHRLDQFFSIKKIKADFLLIDRDQGFDIIYYDAFAPDKQGELWTIEAFNKAFDLLRPGGILTTYCAKGIVKRRLREVGFIVEAIPGPPGKREMTRAIRSA
ncbi:MAG TPA: SAM-dependent methyltransferase [Bacteroidetes bacterium]|nr:SAM-dependent methyltransferase [Bacteroidota bacterium]